MTYTPPLPRAMTTTELDYIRRDGQSTSLYLAILNPAVIYTARINQTFTTLDMVEKFIYDGGSGTLANVLPNMTMKIGTTAGASDIGLCRVRKTPTSTIFYISEESVLALADNLYVTIVDDVNGIWARHLSVKSEIPYMDYDVAYTDQHKNTLPIPILGARYVPAWLTGITPVAVIPFSASLSYTLPDTSITGYSWSAPGCSASSEMTTATPTITYNTIGTFRVSCTLTAANGKTNTGYVYVQTFDNTYQPITQFNIRTISGSSSSGGWNFQIVMWDDAALPTVQDRAMVVLFAKEFYGETEISLGQNTNREYIVSTGWVSGESIIQDPDGSSVQFKVETANAWIKKMMGFPIGIQNSTSDATAWTNWKNLTVDTSLYHLLYWQSTVIPAVDVFLTGDTKYSTEQYAIGNVGEQIKTLLGNTLMGNWGANIHNRLFFEVDTQITPVTSRTYNTVISLQSQDWQDQIQIDRITVHPTSQVDLSGVVIDANNNSSSLFSLAPGHIFEQWGSSVRQEKMLLSTQALANGLAAMKLAWDNHKLEFTINIASNNRMVDIFPSHQYVGLTVTPSDTPRGIAFSGHVLVREITITFTQNGNESGYLTSSWRCEEETFPANYTNGDVPPITGTKNFTVATPPPPDFPPIPNFPFGGGEVPIEVTPCQFNSPNSFPLAWSPNFLNGGSGTLVSKAYFPCYIRSGYSTPTSIDISINTYGDVINHIYVYGVAGGSRVLSAVLSFPYGSVAQGGGLLHADFSPISDTYVDGFELVIDAGIGTSPITNFTLGEVIETGTKINTYSNTVTTNCVQDQYYALNLVSGWWKAGLFADGYQHFNFYNGTGSMSQGRGVGFNGVYFTAEANSDSGFIMAREVSIKQASIYGEPYKINGIYGQGFFKADNGATTPPYQGMINCPTTLTLPNGTEKCNIVWELRNAYPGFDTRRLGIGSSTLYNVCA